MRKTFRTMLVAFMAMAMVAFVGCNKENDANGHGGNNNGTGHPRQTVEWVDLGLPSGLLWAASNVGANAPEEFGDYFAWGETQPKDVYDWSHYRYCTTDAEGNLSTLTKYNSSTDYGPVDNLTILQVGDDAATVNIGNGARTPTREECRELLENTTSEWTTLNGINGRKLTAANGNSIFLPAAGSRHGLELVNVGSYGIYWSASRYTPEYGNNFWVSYEMMYCNSCDQRYIGQSVRAVRASQK